ncbi:MAG: substrate-binding domain-containing protein, partial [Oscillospiraceae bacterium]
GIVGGTWGADYFKKLDKTEVNVILVSSQTEQQVKRCTGFVAGLEKNGIKVNVLNTYDGGKRETAMAASEDALTAFDNIDVIYGGSAQDSLGAFDATQGANRKEVLIVGFDGEDEEIEKIDAKTNYIASITQDPKGQAELVAKYVDLWQKGETFAQKEETPAGVYCAEGQFTGAEILG